jgi:ferredoxin-type protein NapF
MATLSRRNFLKLRLSRGAGELRPPWALPEPTFTSVCTRCGDCSRACPEAILVKGTGGFPRVEFSRGACTFCGKCVESCAAGALRRESVASEPWNYRARVGGSCLALNRTVCRSCGEACEARAIRFRHRPGGVAVPDVLHDQCTGCGACVSACPVRAIDLAPWRAESLEMTA